MVLPGYEVIRELYRHEWYALYRGLRLRDRQPVLLHLPHRQPPLPVEIELLEREFDLLRSLSVSGLPQAQDLSRDDGGCCLVLEDRGAEPLRATMAGRGLELDAFFNIANQLATILAELHQREIIHRSLHPGGILLHPETGDVLLADLTLAVRSAGETESLVPLSLLRGTLGYLSPEQTGRMNRATDYRADFYSLGVIFYELLTGAPPFQSGDLLELIHWHIAKTPPAPAELDGRIPQPLSQIVMKLLAKTAEERYQSATGLKKDLELCAREWAAHRQIASFPLGLRDLSDRFLISQKLYGRSREVSALLNAFDRVCQPRAAEAARSSAQTSAQTSALMLLVTGYSGIGKTSLIQELYKPIVRERGYFISGKFDQVVRSVPFGALIQAFRELVRQLLTESEEQLAGWRQRLSEALGANGGVLAEVIPEIELIIGKQPRPAALGPTETLNRFQFVFQNFVGAIARAEHPLVVFLDDLQWADSATLSLLEPLLTGSGARHLFLMGAYRDNEVDETHPLLRTLSALQSAGVELRRVTLGPLQLPDLTLFLRDTLHGTLADAEPLARLVFEKTGGNPFFVIQFLKALRQEGFLTFDYDQGRWAYQLDAIAAAPLTDNVIDLMTRKIQRLSRPTQQALTLAACIGSPFDAQTLAVVSEQTAEAIIATLAEALQEGLILPAAREEATEANPAQAGAAYVFLHDRVQQAAYSLITDEWRPLIHLTVGRLLHSRPAGAEEKLFDVVHHLNIGGRLMSDEAERLALARLNLSAGRKAKSSTANEAALNYFNAGLGLLDDSRWESDYDLAFDMHLEAAECQYLCGDFDGAEERFALLLGRARTNLDRAKVYRLRSVQAENLSRYADALAIARESLALFGVSFPDADDEKQAALDAEIGTIQSLLNGRSIESLIDLPEMTDPAIRMVMNTLTDIWSSAYIAGDPVLARLISATMVRLSLTHGNQAESAYGYVTHAITVGPVLADYESAYEFGRLALRVNERFHDSNRRAKIHQQFHAHVNLWRKPMRTCVAYAREACRSGLESGDFLYAAYGASTESWPAFLSAQDLAQFVRELSPNLALIRKLKITSFADALKVMLNWAQALAGKTRAPRSLSDEEFDEVRYAETYRGNAFFTTFQSVARLHLCYLFGEYETALEIAQRARESAHQLSGTIWPVLFEFWNGLTLAANYANATESDQPLFLHEMQRAQRSLVVLADNCPENFRCQSLLLAAELERVAGREPAAQALYEQALRYAEETNQIQHRALANELSGRFWLGRGQPKVGLVFLAEARSCYGKWGAAAKRAALDREFPDLPAMQATSHKAAAPEPLSLDISSVSKVAHAIAAEIELDGLLRKLIKIAVENAGAQRGVFLQERDGKLLIEAEGAVEREAVDVLHSVPLDRTSKLPTAVVQYVRKTGEPLVIGDAAEDERFSADPYVAAARPRSILCMPVVHQGKIGGILYLENNLAADAFTADRIEVLTLLSAQAAISLENARVYHAMRQEAEQRRQAEETLRSIVEGTAAVTGGDFFASLVRHLAAALRVQYAFVTECLGETKARVQMLAFWKGDRLAENVSYEIAETPCLNVIAGQVCFYPQGIQSAFPNDHDLVALCAESYLGIPIHNAGGDVIGHLAVLDDGPMAESPRRLSLLKIFAARAGAELERLRAEAGLRAALAEVERLKNRLQAENVYLREEIRREHNFEEIVGGSPALLDTLQRVERVAPTDSTVLIFGETGTGKELIARAIHNRSARRDRPLVKVNCGAISAGLVESELFGHVKGAFTGAIERRTGRFELADGGTLFLDEVGELPLDTQVKLLRVLQEGEFEPVGSSRTVRVNVRIIAATNRNLAEAVREGRFRSDLFYRLNVLPLALPPLRERRSDIPQLVMFFLARFAKRFGKKIDNVSRETMERLVQYSWPGNIRELQNIIERGVVLSQGPVLTLDQDLFVSAITADRATTAATVVVSAPVFAPAHGPTTTDAAAAFPPATDQPLSIQEVERRHILGALEQTAWVIEGPNGAAKVLNLHPNTLRGRMKKLGIQRPSRAV